MPSMQSAVVANYDFGAPVVEDVVLSFRVKENQGGKLDLMIENQSENPLTATIQVSEDGVTYADTSVADLEVLAKTRSDGQTILLRQGLDKFVRVQAVGGTRGRLQVRPDSLLDIIRI